MHAPWFLDFLIRLCSLSCDFIMNPDSRNKKYRQVFYGGFAFFEKGIDLLEHIERNMTRFSIAYSRASETFLYWPLRAYKAKKLPTFLKPSTVASASPYKYPYRYLHCWRDCTAVVLLLLLQTLSFSWISWYGRDTVGDRFIWKH